MDAIVKMIIKFTENHVVRKDLQKAFACVKMALILIQSVQNNYQFYHYNNQMNPSKFLTSNYASLDWRAIILKIKYIKRIVHKASVFVDKLHNLKYAFQIISPVQ